MITGASQAETAAIIIDAEEGVKEQTKRHAFILSMLGMKNVIVLINKMDRVGYNQGRFNAINNAFTHFLKEIRLNAVDIIPISASKGDNVVKRSDHLPWYAGHTFLEALDSLHLKKNEQDLPVRFVVQDIYNFSKRIIAGKVVSGVLPQNEMVTILPSGESTQILSLEEYLKSPTTAETGKCIGITTTDKVFCDRGYVFSDPDDTPRVTHQFRANIFWMDKVPCKKGETVIFRCSTQESRCTITAFHTVIDSSSLEQIGSDTNEIKNREVAQVTIHTDNPVILEEFSKTAELGRFVLVTNDVSAGGIITEVLQ